MKNYLKCTCDIGYFLSCCVNKTIWSSLAANVYTLAPRTVTNYWARYLNDFIDKFINIGNASWVDIGVSRYNNNHNNARLVKWCGVHIFSEMNKPCLDGAGTVIFVFIGSTI